MLYMQHIGLPEAAMSIIKLYGNILPLVIQNSPYDNNAVKGGQLVKHYSVPVGAEE